MEERIFKLSLDKAKQWYNGSSQDLKRIALEVYNEEELTKVELPNSWEEFYLSKSESERKVIDSILNSIGFNIKYPSSYKLELLRDCYRQGWEPDWHSGITKYCICNYFGKLEEETCTHVNVFLSFQSKEIRDKFLENFRALIKEACDLI